MDRATRKQYWTEQVREFRASGSSRVAFCRAHGYSTWALKYWEKRIGGEFQIERKLTKPKKFAAVELLKNNSLDNLNLLPAPNILIRFAKVGIEIESQSLPSPEWLMDVASRMPLAGASR
jgi:hypothetical protein